MKDLCYLELPFADSFRGTQNATNWNQCWRSLDGCAITSLPCPPKGMGALGCLFTRPVFGFMERLRGIFTSWKRLGGSKWAQSNLWGYWWMNIWWKLSITYCNKKAECKVASSQEMDGDKEWITFCKLRGACALPLSLPCALQGCTQHKQPHVTHHHFSGFLHPHLNSFSLDPYLLASESLTQHYEVTADHSRCAYKHTWFM